MAREQKRKEKEAQQRKRKEERAAKARKKKGEKWRKRSPTPSSDVENYDRPGISRNSLLSSSSSESGDIPHTTTRDVRVPVRFQDDESELSDGSQSDTVCEECQCREPVGYDGDDIFWIHFVKCQRWFHVFCICGRNYANNNMCVRNVNLTCQNTFLCIYVLSCTCFLCVLLCGDNNRFFRTCYHRFN